MGLFHSDHRSSSFSAVKLDIRRLADSNGVGFLKVFKGLMRPPSLRARRRSSHPCLQAHVTPASGASPLVGNIPGAGTTDLQSCFSHVLSHHWQALGHKAGHGGCEIYHLLPHRWQALKLALMLGQCRAPFLGVGLGQGAKRGQWVITHES